MASGVSCAADVLPEYGRMKTESTYKYMMFRLSNDKKNIIVAEEDCLKNQGEKKRKGEGDDADTVLKNDKECWEAMVEGLQDDEPRYIVYDVKHKTKEGRSLEKLVFISWCADTCPVKKRMVHAASEEYLRKSLEGITGNTIQAHDKGDLDYSDAALKGIKA